MGMSLFHSIGPYLKVIVTKVSKDVKYKSCSNPACSMHKKDMSSSFCPKCGGAQSSLTKSVSTDVIDLDQILCYEQKEALSECKPLQDKCLRYIEPNRINPNRIKFSGNEQVLDINPLQREIDLKWFDETFAKEIQQIKDLVGAENVSVHWGLISYYS